MLLTTKPEAQRTELIGWAQSTISEIATTSISFGTPAAVVDGNGAAPGDCCIDHLDRIDHFTRPDADLSDPRPCRRLRIGE